MIGRRRRNIFHWLRSMTAIKKPETCYNACWPNWTLLSEAATRRNSNQLLELSKWKTKPEWHWWLQQLHQETRFQWQAMVGVAKEPVCFQLSKEITKWWIWNVLKPWHESKHGSATQALLLLDKNCGAHKLVDAGTYTAAQDHQQEAERNNRFLKERVRSTFHRLPYRSIPKIMIILSASYPSSSPFSDDKGNFGDFANREYLEWPS